MGFGDVTLMAMIGSFLGWQPVVLVFLLAPLCGMAVSISVRLFTGRTFIPYGPYLGAAAFLVLVSWRWIWMFEVPWSAGQSFSIRRLFGDWQSLLIVAGIALAALVVQLVFIRMFQAIPVGSRTQTGTAEAAETVDTSQPASGIDTDDPQKRDESNTIQD
jgi:leader peptidase (prepilin peptidase)/N-methyltransferase